MRFKTLESKNKIHKEGDTTYLTLHNVDENSEYDMCILMYRRLKGSRKPPRYHNHLVALNLTLGNRYLTSFVIHNLENLSMFKLQAEGRNYSCINIQ